MQDLLKAKSGLICEAKLNCKLAEGCIWDKKNKIVYFVDIEFRFLYIFDPVHKTISKIPTESYISDVVLDADNNPICAVKDTIYNLDLKNTKFTQLIKIDSMEGLRFNDGKCDKYGNLWIGTMKIEQDEDALCAGALYCINENKVVAKYDDFTIPNGLAWNNDGSIFYHIDTVTRKIDAYDVVDKINLGNKRTVFTFEDEKGSPDGMCIDAQGRLWVAMWGGYSVNCVDPKTSEIIYTIQVPDKNVTCCAFGGEELDTLYITTARSEEGDGGNLYSIKLNTKGVESYRYGK
ncbi:SMP-30/gluconolactonase/LRE family protein [Vallitalea guaymasensis]|uniref:Regucalcin n=1 Tax=Vallitalea guaymasensis TaxID=1185412 RepID=A0A8J8SDV9_9FIRM|nr:SMP-30/gluconolactonase/LRE family protein [Vallitalea guaymasensis]QUH30925.1 SMP-30/gluconolactonase/LRE family protein [Vallitalea guaymasensis]